MIKISKYQNNYVDYQGLIIIQSDNIDQFLLNLSSEESIEINDSFLTLEDFLIISPLTKLSDLYQFASKNILYKYLINSLEWAKEKVFNGEILENYSDSLNSFIGDDLISFLPDAQKITKYIFDIDENKVISKNSLLKFLHNFTTEGKVNIILKNIDFIKINDLTNFLSYYNFIIINSNPFKLLNNWEELELIYIDYETELIHIENYEILKFHITNKFELFDIDYKDINKDSKLLRKIKNYVDSKLSIN